MLIPMNRGLICPHWACNELYYYESNDALNSYQTTIAYQQWNINAKCVRLGSESGKQLLKGLEKMDVIKEFFRRLNGGIILIFVAVTLLWNTPVVYPLKIFVVFMHEISHGIAAMATGGKIVEIVVVSQEGGHAITRGGSPFWTLTAGYLGSMIWGGLILLLAVRARLDNTLSVIIGIGMIVVSVLYLRNLFGLLFGIGFGAALLISGKFLNKIGKPLDPASYWRNKLPLCHP